MKLSSITSVMAKDAAYITRICTSLETGSISKSPILTDLVPSWTDEVEC